MLAMRTLAVSIFLLSSAGLAGAGEKLTFKDLPGVRSVQQRIQAETPQKCTTTLDTFYDHGHPGYPVRVYSCGDGQLSFRSTEPPLDIRPARDPYVHGERTIKLSGR